MAFLKPTILVTGGAGYIGSHVVKALQQKGYSILVLDSLVYGHRDVVENVLKVELIVGDICDRTLLDHIFATRNISAVMHFAAYAYVGESVKDPGKYYRNNVAGTVNLLESMVAANVLKLVFSSTCATYGVPNVTPITETVEQSPINPYGTSKLIVEKILADFDTAHDLKSVCFRYFNAAGASPDGTLGEDHTPETHLIPLVLQAALGQRDSISIFGTDYPTPDGSCVRDYIHVTDLAQAHLLGLGHLLKDKQSEVFNLGNGNGFSVREVIKVAQQVTGHPIKVIEAERRPGDPPILVGSHEKAKNFLGWTPQFADLKDIMTHAWRWHQKRHGYAQQPVVHTIKPKVSQRLKQQVLAGVNGHES